jgi:cobaltochelatase CobS
MNFQVSSHNRHIARTALRAAGVQNVGAMSLQNLQDHMQAHYDAGTPAVVAAVRDYVEPVPWPAPVPADPYTVRYGLPIDPVPAPVPATEPATPKSQETAPSPDAAKAARDVGEALAALLRAGSGPAVDMATLERVVAEQVTKAQLPRELIIRTDDVARPISGASHYALPQCVKALAARIGGKRNNLLLKGPAGCGKTTLAKQIAQALGLEFKFTGAVQSKYELLGHTTATGDVVRTPFRDAFEHGTLFLWDELDGSDAKALVAFNAAIDNGVCAFPDKVIEAHENFVIVATANTWGHGATAEYVGRNKLDAATLDRYVPMALDYDEQLERDMVGTGAAAWAAYVQRVRAEARKLGIKRVISPRATIAGARLLAGGWNRDDTAGAVLFAGMDDDTAAKLRSAAR